MAEKYQSLETMRREDGTKGEMVKLPDRDKMLKRLINGVGDEPNFQERFYPLLLDKQERVISPEGIVVFLASALSEYAESALPGDVADVRARVDDFVDALTPGGKDDPRIADIRIKAKKIWRDTYGEPKLDSEIGI